jgi:hypothetical protein
MYLVDKYPVGIEVWEIPTVRERPLNLNLEIILNQQLAGIILFVGTGNISLPQCSIDIHTYVPEL